MSEFDKSNSYTTPTQLRWKPKPVDTVEESAPIDFVEGLYTVCGAGSSFLRHGFAIHMYACIGLPIISSVTMDIWNLICFFCLGIPPINPWITVLFAMPMAIS